MKSKKARQAIVLIHGIGEQRPIITLRGFVESVSEQLRKNNEAKPEAVLFWDKPDTISGSYETRKMTMGRGDDHPITDFYEFYWAHHMRNTNWSHIKDWLQRVVFRLPKNVSKRLLPVFLFLWFLILAVVCLVVFYIYNGTFGILISGTVFTIVLGFLSKKLFNYLGDAGRYLDPSAENISERQAIREEGMNLLKKLHESKKYQRIIIVGHSLGSVIAYDLIKFLWNDYYKSFDKQMVADLYHISRKQRLDDMTSSENEGKKLDGTPEAIDAFQQAQEKSFDSLKAIGNEWLVTDLVTIGSPLTYAGHVYVQDDGLFEKLKEQREYPTCPPHFQQAELTNIVESEKFKMDGFKNRLKTNHFNHSSPFAVTKWTNIYYSSDFIGGPLKDAFGAGIKDIEVKMKNRIKIYRKGHTEYWDFKNPNNILNHLWIALKR